MSSIGSNPATLVVFGATGDLMARKIGPALFYLYEHDRLPERFRVVGVARRPLTDDDFRRVIEGSVRTRMSQAVSADPEALVDFLAMFTYSSGTFEDPDTYATLAEDIDAAESAWGGCGDKLFYLAVPPQFYEGIFRRLSASGLTGACGGGEGWTRVLVEKPFGRDARSAQALDELLGSLFKEEQIYRIDHYLAKEMLQSIMNFRFSNNLLEPSWSGKAIESIEIDLLESIGAEDRGAFYDGVGALRDVGQNHLLQMLALVTMGQPETLGSAAIRTQRVELLRQLRPPAGDEVVTSTFRAQYDGYRSIAGVAPDSTTETYFKLRTFLDVPRWAGVPVIMQAGKRVGDPLKRIVVRFEHPHPCTCERGVHPQNKVVFSLDPTESISIEFWTKRPGLENDLEPRTFDFFLYEKEAKAQYVEEYAKLLLDAIHGDQTLFVSTDEVRAMWEFTDPIIEAWGSGRVPLERYVPDTAEVTLRATLAIETTPAAAHASGTRPEIGIVGLGRMGEGLARNLADHGWRVVGWNRTAEAAAALAAEGVIEAQPTLAELVGALGTPRVVWVMVPAGAAVDAVLFGPEGAGGGLADLLAAGDTVIDGGNSFYKDDGPRAARLAERGIAFLDVGTSGGPAGARSGACLMIGGARADFQRLDQLWRDASVASGFRHFDGAGAGHFVKMVHNGIEYGMMQAIAEGFAIMRASDFELDLTEVADVYQHGSVVESRLVGWLQDGLAVFGENLKGVSGTVGHTGEGAWTVMTAAELGVKARVIEEALQFRKDSERDPSYTGQLLQAMRNQFGQHAIDG